MSLARINRALKAAHPEVELVRGEGYHYFVFDDPAANVFESESVMCMYTNALPDDRWIADGIAFAEKLKGDDA